MKKNKIFPISFLLLLLLSACMSYKEVEYQGIENAKLKKIEQDGSIELEVQVKVNNPNDYDILILPSKFDLLVSDQAVGSLKSTQKVKLQKLSTNTYSVPLKGKIKIPKGETILQSMLKYALLVKLDLSIKGKLKVSAKGLFKSFPIEETQSINPKKIAIPKGF